VDETLHDLVRVEAVHLHLLGVERSTERATSSRRGVDEVLRTKHA